jgi:hypothetical protein
LSKFEKAFSNTSYGKVLGIFFDTESLSWSLPAEKLEKILGLIVQSYEHYFGDGPGYGKTTSLGAQS